MTSTTVRAVRYDIERQGEGGFPLAGTRFVLDPAGALYWPAERLIIVADLHLEKGSAMAARGALLPPYDSRATLAVLAQIVDRWRPRAVVSLGDSFHDRRGAERLGGEERGALARLLRGREMIWVAGNHDPDPMPGLGGSHVNELTIGPITLRHEPQAGDSEGEIAGHLHPVARLVVRGQSLRRRCFATDGKRLVMPALGAYAGGLNVRDPAIEGLFAGAFAAHLAGGARIYRFAHHACLPDH
ncbi:hypothetical protein FHS55_003709 [Angulomicrobium tetraedrale]|uniref:Calcineurin-like phosphoesterase domain-containing protein n=1 Tax=Ancylobacter tetraedralis TaxID=217068 RepID=A0A839ZEE2_9HYPH|nr:hypothetical protein [Ancylobacter tetraedralis]